ncbi:hypothetical protein [Micromonospora cathayae]|uniref:Ig-like domain-containing protein n=1 Tax=Micromonospora cathayae TaxID=3028804 RepID=A0ABY7ZWA9_9ACTN|nr:hypothetical protein [Micromonospora sp. HUAS 3]WDZ86064.1 hypothetical protein PVK37_06460 [Micromonospora sp. HUAS 3]
MGSTLKRVAAGIAGGVMALTVAAAPAQASGAFTVDLTCGVPDIWGTTCDAAAVNGTGNYTWQWFYEGYTGSPYTTTTPYTASGVGCPPGVYQTSLGVSVRDGAGRTASQHVYVVCGWV